MGAQPVPTTYPQPWHPDPVRQRRADYTLEDVLNLPDDTPGWNSWMEGCSLCPAPAWPTSRSPACSGCGSARMRPATVGRRFKRSASWRRRTHTFEPDVLLIDADADPQRHYPPPEQVELAVEIVSPGTKRRDRIEKPADYAAAKIKHYWRVELDPVHVFAYRLGPAGHYELVADSAELLELPEPFPVKLPISELTP